MIRKVPGLTSLAVMLVLAPYRGHAENGPQITGRSAVTTIAGGWTGDGGLATAAVLDLPADIAVDSGGNVFISETWGRRIRKIRDDGTISTLAGNGVFGFSGDGGMATQASFAIPGGISVDLHGNVYVADKGNQRIRQIDTAGTITTVAGSGNRGFGGDKHPAILANLGSPEDVAVDDNGNLFIADTKNHRIRKVDTTGIITTVVGNGKKIGYSTEKDDFVLPTQGRLGWPESVVVASQGNLLISDHYTNLIRDAWVEDGLLAVPGGLSGGLYRTPIILTDHLYSKLLTPNRLMKNPSRFSLTHP